LVDSIGINLGGAILDYVGYANPASASQYLNRIWKERRERVVTVTGAAESIGLLLGRPPGGTQLCANCLPFC